MNGAPHRRQHRTALIVSDTDATWLAPTAQLLRERGLKVLHIQTFSLVTFLTTSDRISAILMQVDRAPGAWGQVCFRLARTSPDTRIVVVSRDDERSPTDLAMLAAPIDAAPQA